jgi:predicted phage terminase large subunit-like protein
MLDPFTYAAQYQQEPEGDASQVVDVSRFNKFNGNLSGILGKSFITIDSAMSTKEYADRSVISKWTANREGVYHIGSVFGRWDFLQLLENTRAVYDEFHKAEIYVEDKVSGTSLYQTLRDEIRIRPWRPSEFRFPESKQGRVQHSLPMLYSGKCVFTLQTPQEMFDEFHWFRNDMSHEHDDFVDTVTMACSIWLYMGGKVL